MPAGGSMNHRNPVPFPRGAAYHGNGGPHRTPVKSEGVIFNQPRPCELSEEDSRKPVTLIAVSQSEALASPTYQRFTNAHLFLNKIHAEKAIDLGDGLR